MKLRAQFPQIGQAAPEVPVRAARNALRRAFWPTTTQAAPAPGDELVAVAQPAKAETISASPAARAQLASGDWASTVAAWRSTTGLNDDRT